MTAPKLTEAQLAVLRRMNDGKLHGGNVFANLGLTEVDCEELLDLGLIQLDCMPLALWLTEAGRKAVGK